MTVKYYTPSGKLPNDEVSIFAVITCSRVHRFKITTDEKILKKHWDKRAQCAKTGTPGYEAINSYLDDFKRNIVTLYRENRHKSFAEFKALCQGVVATDEKKTLAHALKSFIEHWREEKDELTVKKYEALQGHLFGSEAKEGDKRSRRIVGYSHVHGAPDFPTLNWNFYDTFRSFLYGKGLIDSSVYKYITNLKTVLRWARKRTFPVDPAFEDWPVVNRVNKVISLTHEEINALKNAILPKNLALARDIFLFAVYTSCRISDILHFDVKDYNPVTQTWTYRMRKGRNLKMKPMTQHFVGIARYALEILERYDMKWPACTEQKLNDWIKEAAEKVGITQIIEIEVWKRNKCTVKQVRKCDVLTTHKGRKTHVTLARAVAKSEGIVMQLTGIDSAATMKHYAGEMEQNETDQVLIDMEAKLKAG
jgi:integrase